VLEAAGYRVNKHYFRMMIEMDERPPMPVWPAGLVLRNVVPGQDDGSLFEFIITAFDWPGREAHVTFEQWQDHMMRPDHFIPELWFLLYDGDALIGAALCYDYVDYGWVRQLAVRKDWRGRGLGAALLRHAFAVFFERGRRQVALGVEANNVNALEFYNHVGMEMMRQYDEYRKMIKPDLKPHFEQKRSTGTARGL
jgi:ribosomal protein S18 acetylase RimI-like enzyme